MNYFKSHPEAFLAFAALLVSILAIVFTIWQIRIQRRHNRLSVKPIPEILLSKVEGATIDLKNLGVGPLRCLALLTKDASGKTYYHIMDALPTDLNLNRTVFTNRWNFTILPGETITIFSIAETWTDSSPSENLKRALEALSSLTLSLEYTSIYDEKFPIYQKTLEWLKS